MQLVDCNCKSIYPTLVVCKLCIIAYLSNIKDTEVQNGYQQNTSEEILSIPSEFYFVLVQLCEA